MLSGTANVPGWSGLDIGVQCWVLVALKEGLAAVDTSTLNQHAHAVLSSCLHRLRSEATSVHLVAPILGLISEVCMLLLLSHELHAYAEMSKSASLPCGPLVAVWLRLISVPYTCVFMCGWNLISPLWSVLVLLTCLSMEYHVLYVSATVVGTFQC